MQKTISRDLDNMYLKKHALGSNDFAATILRAVLNETQANSELEVLSYTHYNPLFEHEYEAQLERFASYKKLLDEHLKLGRLKEVQLAYCINSGPKVVHIWRRFEK